MRASGLAGVGFLAWCLSHGPKDREGRAWEGLEQGFSPPRVCSCIFLATFTFLSLEALYQNRGLTVRLLLVVETDPVAGGQESPSCNSGFPREVFNTGQTGEEEVPGAQGLELPRAASWRLDNGERGRNRWIIQAGVHPGRARGAQPHCPVEEQDCPKFHSC